jgi:hypothetical protein
MTVLAIDNFTRANAANLGANWTIGPADNGIPIVSNQITQAAAFPGLEYYNAVVWPTDHYSKLKLITVAATSDNGFGPGVRMTTGGDLYFAQCSTVEIKLYKRIGGAFTQLGADGPPAAANDIIETRAIGTTISVRQNGVQIISVTDSSLSAAGNACIWTSDIACTAVNWEGGDFVAVAAAVDVQPSRARNRPGRGPFNFGRYSLSSIDAFSNPSQIISSTAIGIGIGSGQGTASILNSAIAQAIGVGVGQDTPALTLSALAQAIGKGMGNLTPAQLLSGIATALADASGRADAAQTLAGLAQAVGIGSAQFIGQSLVLVTGAATGIAIGSGAAIPQTTLSSAAQAINENIASAQGSVVLQAIARAIGETQGQVSASTILQAMAQAIAESNGAFSPGIAGIITAAAIGVATGLGFAAPSVVLNAQAQAIAESSVRAIAQQLIASAAIGSSDTHGVVSAAVIIGANANAIAESIARAVVNSSSGSGLRIPNVRIFTIAPDVRIVHIDPSDPVTH